MKFIYYVYQYLREDGTPYYIGKGKGRRAWRHFKGEVMPPRDKSRIELIAHKLYESEAFILERKLIAFYGRKDIGTGILRNKTDGGEGPTNLSAETRARISKANKGKITSEKTKAKISKSKSGITREPFSEEWKTAMSTVRIGKKRAPMSEEAKANISAGRKGIPSKFKGVPNKERHK